jgi:membrane-anchored protein YejM (alkaline phosphatase superfamily)
MSEYVWPVPVLNNMRLQLRRQLKVTPILRNLGNNSVERRGHALAYTEVHPRALAAAADSSFGFVFLHYPIPHPPGIFDPETNELDPREPHGYAGNLELVDRALGELRAAMERAGAWDQTALILTSDHPLRLDFWPEEAAVWGRSSGSPNVPFMVKLPGEKQGLTYASALNNRIVHDLALALLRGEIRTPQELVQWLDARPGAAPSETVAAATR